MNIELPRYAINPQAQKRSIWTPEIYQLVLGQGCTGYLNSVWLGTIWNLILMPSRFLVEVVWNVFNFRFQQALFSLLMLLPTSLWLVYMGLRGSLRVVPITAEIAARSIILSPEQCMTAIQRGYTDVIVDLDKLPDPGNSHTA